jgi:hypothetical protein
MDSRQRRGSRASSLSLADAGRSMGSSHKGATAGDDAIQAVLEGLEARLTAYLDEWWQALGIARESEATTDWGKRCPQVTKPEGNRR